MRKKELISIIVPCYNVEKYMEKCIFSILNQTYHNLEIILVDDGSTDNTSILCDKFVKIDKRVKVIHKENGGLADARNAGLKIANGEYIGFIDSDDYIDSSMFYKLYSACRKYKCKIAICGRYDVIRNRGYKNFCPSSLCVIEDEDILKNFFLRKDYDCSSCDKLYHYTIVQGLYFPKGMISEDLLYVYKALSRVKRIVHIAQPLYFYCYRRDSISRLPFYEKKLDSIILAEKIEQELVNSKSSNLKDFYVFYLSLILGSFNEIQKSEMINKQKNKYIQWLRKRIWQHFFKIIFNNRIKNSYKLECIRICFIRKIV